KRTLDSIDMEPSLKQDILTELQDFFDPESEEWSYENGVPNRKGYLLYGPPGTGKSSFCVAIASEFNLPIYWLHLAGMDDAKLHEEFQKLPQKCVVLIEEIDTAGIARHKGKKEKGKQNEPAVSNISLGALLNEIDGPGAKEGRLLIFTTNSPKSLDPALIRPGRIDRRIYLGRSTKLVASITFCRIFGTDPRLKGRVQRQEIDRMAKQFGELIPNKLFTPCEVQQFCMSHRGNPERAIKQMPQWIKEK
ncbi:mitochondrial chaperone BCS1, partial [Periconia macrospinosa]